MARTRLSSAVSRRRRDPLRWRSARRMWRRAPPARWAQRPIPPDPPRREAFEEQADLRTQPLAPHIAPEQPSRLRGRLLPQAVKLGALACARLTEQRVRSETQLFGGARTAPGRPKSRTLHQTLNLRPELLAAELVREMLDLIV